MAGEHDDRHEYPCMDWAVWQFYSCLPAHITIFDQLATSHLSLAIEDAEMRKMTIGFHSAKLDLDLAMKPYNRFNELPTPWFAASRMKLSCIAFELPRLSPTQTDSGLNYRTEKPVFRMVDIKTRQDLSLLDSLFRPSLARCPPWS